MKRVFGSLILVIAILLSSFAVMAASPDKNIGINVLLNTDITDEILAELGTYGKVVGKIVQIDALTMKVRESQLPAIQALPFVAAASPDAERKGIPIADVAVEDFSAGLNTWNLDAVNVTDFAICGVAPNFYLCGSRVETYTGEGVYVAVLDTGLVKQWHQYFPEERIATEFAKSFGGGGGEVGTVSEQPNKWERDTNSHGTHVTSTILGYSFRGTPINGVAPMAKIIPVKVLNQNGSGWSSAVAQGIIYVADLKASGALGNLPVVINMSLGGPVQEPIEKFAVDYAIDRGVIIVASAGNEGDAGMGYPGAYAPVISVAASGWVGEWTAPGWWYALNVPDPSDPEDFYITDFSSRAKAGQDLDVAAPGSWVVGPYHVNQGNAYSYYYLGGTSMASPHVAGIIALMAQKDPNLSAGNAEQYLEDSATHLAPGCQTVNTPWGPEEYCWEADATGAGLVTADAALAATP